MLEAIKSFFQNNIAAGDAGAAGAETEESKEGKPESGERRIEVAACALLLELAHADDEFSDAERQHIEIVLRAVGGHRSKAASVLGISRKVLWEKLKDYSIE